MRACCGRNASEFQIRDSGRLRTERKTGVLVSERPSLGFNAMTFDCFADFSKNDIG